MPQVDFFLFPIQAFLFIIFFSFFYFLFSFEILPEIFKIFEVRKFLTKKFEKKVKFLNFLFYFNINELFIEKLILKIFEVISIVLYSKIILFFLNYFQFFLVYCDYFFFFFSNKIKLSYSKKKILEKLFK